MELEIGPCLCVCFTSVPFQYGCLVQASELHTCFSFVDHLFNSIRWLCNEGEGVTSFKTAYEVFERFVGLPRLGEPSVIVCFLLGCDSAIAGAELLDNLTWIVHDGIRCVANSLVRASAIRGWDTFVEAINESLLDVLFVVIYQSICCPDGLFFAYLGSGESGAMVWM